MLIWTGSQIDFTAVGTTAKINANAARMRFVRLKKAIESANLHCSDEHAPDNTSEHAAQPQQQQRKQGTKRVRKHTTESAADNARLNEDGSVSARDTAPKSEEQMQHGFKRVNGDSDDETRPKKAKADESRA